MSTSGNISSTVDRIEAVLPDRVTPIRFRHIRGVEKTALDLARRFSIDEDPVRLVALSHDMDRDTPPPELFRLAAEWGVELTPFQQAHPNVIHGPVTAARLEREYGVGDATILDAVRHHTLGDPILADQTVPLGLVLYVADFCEPDRTVPDRVLREAILALESPAAMALRIIRELRALFGPLEEPTEHLYARLAGNRE